MRIKPGSTSGARRPGKECGTSANGAAMSKPESLEVRRERLFKAMTARLGREPLWRDIASLPEPVIAELERYYIGDGSPIRVG
jgi:hypothetical protein